MCGCVGVKVHVYMYQDYLHLKIFAVCKLVCSHKN